MKYFILFFLFCSNIFAQTSLPNTQIIGQSARNQGTGNGLVVADTIIVNGVAIFNNTLKLASPSTGTGSDSVIVYDAATGILKKVAQSSISGGGTISSISQGYGITNTPNPIVATGTIAVDSATIATYFVRRKDSTNTFYPFYSNPKSYLTTAVTSVGSGFGVTGGTITTTGTLKADTARKSGLPTYFYVDSTNTANGTAWKVIGNSGTIAGTNFLGTTDNTDVMFKRNGQKAGLIDSTLGETHFGYQSGNANTTGANNTAIGFQSYRSNTDGANNTSIGYASQFETNTTGADANTSIGAYSLNKNQATENTGLGYGALKQTTTGHSNTAAGSSAMFLNTTGYKNVGVGIDALYNNTTGFFNVAMGQEAMYFNGTGYGNTAIGQRAGYNCAGTHNLFLGDSAGFSWTGSNRGFVGIAGNDSLITIDFINSITNFNGTIKITGGGAGANKVLQSDASGNGSWVALGSMARADSVSYHGNSNITTIGTITSGTVPYANLSGVGTMAKTDSVFYHGNSNITTVGTLSSGSIASGFTAIDTARTNSVSDLAVTAPIVVATSGKKRFVSCPTCITSAASLTNNSLIIGGGLQAASTTTTGTGVLTALGISTGSVGSVITNGGVLGTPSSGFANNLTGLPEGGLSLTDITTNNTSTSAHGFYPKLTANSVYYVSNAGALTPLTVGASNTVLTGNGVTSAPTWTAVGACTTCVTSAASLTNNQLMFGAGSQASAVGDLTGDITTSGGKATTLATVNSNVGSFTNASVTVNGKGLVTAASSGIAPEVPLTFSTGLTRTTNTITANLATGVSGGQSAIGGTGIGDFLTLKSTTGIGSTDYINFTVGNNGATECMRVNTGGHLVIGATTSVGGGNGYNLNVIADVGSVPFSCEAYGGGQAGFNNYCARGTKASPTALQSSDEIATFAGFGYGTSFGSANIYMSMRCAETFTGSAKGNYIVFATTPVGSTSRTEKFWFDGSGRIGLGVAAGSITALLHIKAGTTAAGTAPLKFNSGSLMTTAEAGAIEFLTDKWYATITTAAARKEITLNDAALTSGRVPVSTTNGRLTDYSGLTFDGTNLTVGAATNIVGTATNNSATAGNIGEEIDSTLSTYTNYTTSATYQRVASITLTAGDWDIRGFGSFSANTATITLAANAIFLISTTTASASGATEGKNIAYIPQNALIGTSIESISVPSYRVSIASTTTYYLNSQATFTIGNPQVVGGLSARRCR